jgi:membrane protease YdiL (CAAX protease family)
LSRTAVRLVLLFVVLAAVDIACQLLGGLLIHRTPGMLRDVARIGAAVFLSAVMLGSYRALVRAIERRNPQELGSRTSASALSVGVIGGAGLLGLVYGILWTLGAADFQGFGGFSGLGAALAVAIASAVGEEVVFRGVVFRLLEASLGTTLALVLSAAAFGAVHAGNPGATWVSTLAIALESGVLLGVAYAATRTLWLPIGLHFGWNFTEGGIFGAAVSGGHNTGLVLAPLSGPPFITGGAFGPEASVVAVAVSLIASAALARLALRRSQWRRWQRTSDASMAP